MKSDNPRATFSRISAVCDERCPRGTFLPTVASPTREGGREGAREGERPIRHSDKTKSRKRKKLRASGWQTHWLTTKALLTKKGEEEEEEEKPKEEEVSLSK